MAVGDWLTKESEEPPLGTTVLVFGVAAQRLSDGWYVVGSPKRDTWQELVQGNLRALVIWIDGGV